jgi:mRNA interferase RelE/StbE
VKVTRGSDILQIKYEKTAVKYLKSLQKPQRDTILSAISGLTQQPAKGDIKKMSGYKDDRYRLRVGKYRVIYKYESDGKLIILIVMDIGSRGDIYK